MLNTCVVAGNYNLHFPISMYPHHFQSPSHEGLQMLDLIEPWDKSFIYLFFFGEEG